MSDVLPEVVYSDVITGVSGCGGSGFSSEPNVDYSGLSLRDFIKEERRKHHDTYLKQYLLALVLLSLVRQRTPAFFKGVSFNIFDNSRKVILEEPLTGLDVPTKLTLNVIDVAFAENFDSVRGYYIACCVADLCSMSEEVNLQRKLIRAKEAVSQRTHMIRGKLSNLLLAKSMLEKILAADQLKLTQTSLLVDSIRLLDGVVEGVNQSLPKKSELDLTPEKKTRGLVLKSFNLVSYVNETFKACSLEQKKVSSMSKPILKLVLKSEMPTAWFAGVHLNRAHVEDVLWNLISNAVKYARTTVSVSLSTHSANTELKVLVRDDGVGIPAHKIKDVFKGGAVQSGLNQIGGAHVGLSHCKRSADRYSDKLLVRNQLKSGAEFEFTTGCSPPKTKKKVAEVTPAVLLKKNCILIEDNSINMKLLTRTVKQSISAAYIRTFVSAKLALAYILQHPDVSFVVSDQELGDDLTGLVFFKMLKIFYASHPKYSLPKCAIATGYAEVEQCEDVHHIVKPVTRNSVSAFFRPSEPENMQDLRVVPAPVDRAGATLSGKS